MENELEGDGHDYDEVASDDGLLEVILLTWFFACFTGLPTAKNSPFEQFYTSRFHLPLTESFLSASSVTQWSAISFQPINETRETDKVLMAENERVENRTEKIGPEQGRDVEKVDSFVLTLVPD